MVTPAPQDRWSQDKHIKLVNIIGNLGAGMLTRAMYKQLSAASAYECLFVDFLSKEEHKKTLVPAPYGKTIIGSKWVFRNKRVELGIVIKNKARLMAQDYIQQQGIDYDETFAPVVRLEAIGIFLAFATYRNFIVYQMDVKSAFLNVKTPMVLPNNLGPDLSGKSINETQYRGVIRSLMYLTASRPDIQFSTCLCARYQANPKESHLIAVKRIFRYLKGTPSLGLWYPKCLGFDLKGYSDSNYAGCNMERKITPSACQLLGGKLVPIFGDNTSAIAISNNPVLHSRIKHIDIKYHFIIDHVLRGDIELHFISTQYQLADIFTKTLDEPNFKRLSVELGMLNINSKPEASVLPEEN
uniref:Reverse transcriptase Ty1/copia-type domain-containing protein n=1 Tax=Tanacetum cinerariifolium TaxID=118510 RepID=A0A6L2M5B2_TANCI|nr:hypothetical protein [Tanacetum cinerariifolium]